ncbi:uncharacterized protein At4g15970-like isoform X1 [Ziziphus jujuba]|uniref:Uncharacterized protein At4g15970-like isoform X1 n=2 Tax=Ziziphus jujuba TaxID=326968 RepID=A0A6P4A6G9_ZIZJJ|nr:uncharacterized protein At4g15970-like isoform X1 [Ziziphus jujuba]
MMMCKSVGEEVDKVYNSRQVVKIAVIFVGLAVACFVLSNYSVSRSYILDQFFARNSTTGSGGKINKTLDMVLENASMKNNKTVIITTLNDAWAEPNSVFDLFLESFHIGNDTERLLKHLVVICWDEKAYNRCLALHPHCYYLQTEGANFTSEAFFMNQDYLQMMWRRIEFLITILEKGYSFIFTDNDIMWLRDPFLQFYPDAEFQIACDYFLGNSYDVNNAPNGGFNYVKSNNRTIQFYKYWYNSRLTYPGLHDQDVFNSIKYDRITDIGLQLRFLDTAYFGGFCQPSRDLRLVCTMHSNCCVGVENKVHDLTILLEDWRKFLTLDPTNQTTASWNVPQDCRTSLERHNAEIEKSQKGHKK